MSRSTPELRNPHRDAVLEVVADPRYHGGAGVPELALEPELHERPVQLREIDLPCNHQRNNSPKGEVTITIANKILIQLALRRRISASPVIPTDV